MKLFYIISISLIMQSAWADNESLEQYKTLTQLNGDWKLAPASKQEGGATKKGPAAKLVGTDKTAIQF